MKNNKLLTYIKFACGSTVLLASSWAFSAKTHGRFYFGGFAATERFTDDGTASNKNDFLVASTRLFYKVSEMGDDKWEAVFDLRDTHDFFDKLNKEKLQLDSANLYQTRQMSVRKVNPNGTYSYTLGRFPINDAGSVNLDGGLLQVRHNTAWSSSVFTGTSARRIEQSYMHFNLDTPVYGAFVSYSPRTEGWERNIYMNNAFVTQILNVNGNSQVERRYLFHNSMYQWQEDSRIINLIYLDLVPRTYVQTANILWQQAWIKTLSTQVGFLGVDVIEYKRKQDVLEVLAPSVYKEANIKLDYKPGNRITSEISLLTGARDADHLNKTEAILGFGLTQVFSKNYDIYLKAGSRKNFTSKDTIVRAGLGFYSRKWELDGDLEYNIRKNIDDTTTHPLTTELAMSTFLTKDLSGSLSFQRVADERVTIYAGFFKVGYRFGNQAIPPIRDGAPPRGQL